MHNEASKTLAKIQTISQLEYYVECARMELYSHPQDDLMREFVRLNESLIRHELRKLQAVA